MNIKRFYKNELPNINDTVMVKISKEDEYGYYGSLLEYNNLEGFLSLSEIVKGKYIKKHLLKENQILPLVVIKVNNNKQIDLSKKRSEKETEKYVLLKYKFCNNINKFMNECYVMYLKYCDISSSDIIYSINDIMNETIWKLYEENLDYAIILRNILEDPKLVLRETIFPDDFINRMMDNLNNRITKKNLVLEMNLTVLMFEENAILKIKEILDQDLVSKECKVNVLIMSPPLYKIRIEESDKNNAFEKMEKIKNDIKIKSQKYSCDLNFEEIKLMSDSSYEIKFLGDFDLEKISFD